MRQRAVASDAIGSLLVATVLVAGMLTAGCRDAPPAMVEVEVVQVGFDPVVGAPVVVLQSPDARRLPIWIGPGEADAIARQLQGVVPPRPLTHDLMIDLLQSVRAELTRVRITELRAQTFYAVLDLDRGGRTSEIDCRPSDAIALALRAGSPIVVSRGLLERLTPAAGHRSAAGVPPGLARLGVAHG